MVIISEIDRLLTWFDALILTDWDNTDWEGMPEIVPLDELRDSPVGRDPDMIENESWSPLTVGEIENWLFFDKTYEDWG